MMMMCFNNKNRSSVVLIGLVVMVLNSLVFEGIECLDYGEALTKSLLFYEGQRSGRLPPNQRVQWRGDSALQDGSANQSIQNLVGGYYDAGDNLKLGFPMAFTITMLSWSTIEYSKQLKAKNEFNNAVNAIKWGTDYLMKAHPTADVLYGEVGESDSDHQCWQRPEDMTTLRTIYMIDDHHPGSDLAAETAAAFAAASIVFRSIHMIGYSFQLLNHAKQLFAFGQKSPGIYQTSIPDAGKVYASSGYQDEMLWAAAWLYRATSKQEYLDYLSSSSDSGGVRTTFSWDDKYVGAQVLVAKLLMDGKAGSAAAALGRYKQQAEEFICSCVGKGSNNFKRTPGGFLWFLPWNNAQYVATATFVTSVYSNYLTATGATLQCSGGSVTPSDLTSTVQSQVDYLLGSNPLKMSYMVGFGSNYPQQIHHRAASIVSIKKDQTPVSCKGGFDEWFNKNAPNPNVLDGAIVSPDENDAYSDSRSNFQHAEPTTVTNAPLVGVFAHLA
ncbi:endoglucanase 13-like [Humulus lupulus]|uniref:endoglucanase 13-like n=1 Tax=Humulus lupulus TaxID=3486 RepID=UPI002B4075E1|nr:endoglucanase 13-like [Humulus lupulus]